MQYAFGDGYIHDDLQSELDMWRKKYVDASTADDQIRTMETRTTMLRNEVDRLQGSVKVSQFLLLNKSTKYPCLRRHLRLKINC